MSRIKINLPENFSFTTQIPVRVSDLNYGNHVGNDAILTLLHEGRMQFLNSFGYSEMNLEGVGLIMADVGIEYKGEGFYGDVFTMHIAASGLHKYGFDLYYHLINQHGKEIARAKTGILCMDYTIRKLVRLPEKAAMRLETKA